MAMIETSKSAAHYALLSDGSAVLIAGWLAWWLRFARPDMPESYLVAVVLGVLLTLVLLPVLGAYRGSIWAEPLGGLLRVLPGLMAVFMGLVLLAAMTKTTGDFSRLWTGYWFGLALALMAAWRACFGLCLGRRRERQRSRILIVGCGELAVDTAARLVEMTGRARTVVGFVSLDNETAETLPAPLLGQLVDLEALLADPLLGINEIWLAGGDIPVGQRERVIDELQLASLPVRYVPDLTLLNLISHQPRRIAGLTVIELNGTPLDGPDAWVKAALDRVLAALLLIALSPLLLMVAMLIRLDSPGPVLFRQPRHGSDGKVFDVLKFRSMCHSSQTSGFQATRADARVTRVGRIIRRTSIDELPQLINVLRGDMSLVGPRPHPVALNQEYARRIESFMQRHRVKPGITGWAQVNGYRGETDTLEKMQKRLEHDLFYIEHWTLWLDLKILFRTAFHGWCGENAY
ncbi:MAG: undecaprenyl-phosphate glucose phosphotransferase [Wenzhouxiangella sp.]|nr:MAG: undecaprenyl-phosphate glucose phosphotransferase [Wenzhouxiangella sp.]